MNDQLVGRAAAEEALLISTDGGPHAVVRWRVTCLRLNGDDFRLKSERMFR